MVPHDECRGAWACHLGSHLCSQKFCAAKMTDISLSTEVAGYGFGELLHVCHLGTVLLVTMEVKFHPKKVNCLVAISLQGNPDLPHNITATFGVCQMIWCCILEKKKLNCVGVPNSSHILSITGTVKTNRSQSLQYFDALCVPGSHAQSFDALQWSCETMCMLYHGSFQ